MLAITNEILQTPLEKEEIECDKLLNQELNYKIKELKSQLSEEIKSRNTFQQAYLSLMATNNKQLLNAEARESSLIHLLEQKDVEIQRLKAITEKYEKNNAQFEEEKALLLKKIEEYKAEDYASIIQRISEELNETKRLFTASVKQRAFLCNQMQLTNDPELNDSGALNEHDRNLIELKAEIIQYHEENKALRLKLAQSDKNKETLTSKIFELQQIIDTEIPKNIEPGKENKLAKNNAVDAFLAQSGYMNIFKKVHSCYSVNNRIIQIIIDEECRVCVLIKNEKTLIEDFLQQICNKSERGGEYDKIYKSFASSLNSNSSRKSLLSKNSENNEYEKRQKKPFITQHEAKSCKKIPEKLFKERNHRDISSDSKKA